MATTTLSEPQTQVPVATPTIGLLYAGEMGASLAAPLRARGLRVVTTVVRRSPSTVQRCLTAGVQILGTLSDVVRESDIVISLVPPAAAEQMAKDYCALARLAPRAALYVDANSISSELAASLADRLAADGLGFVDAAINGLAKNFTSGGTLFLSGPRAGDVAGLFEGITRVRVLGNEVGRAKAMKMLLAGLSKGACALFVELGLLAERRDMFDEMWEETRAIYPGVAALVERMLPTYTHHAARRATEMRELEETTHAAGLSPLLISDIRRLHEAIATIAFESADAQSVASMIARLSEEQMLSESSRDITAPAAS